MLLMVSRYYQREDILEIIGAKFSNRLNGRIRKEVSSNLLTNHNSPDSYLLISKWFLMYHTCICYKEPRIWASTECFLKL